MYLRQQLYVDKQWHRVTESHLIIPDSFAAAADDDHNDHDDYDDVSVSDDGVTVVSDDVDGHVQ